MSRFAAAFNVVSDTALTARSLRLALAAYDKGGGRGLGFDLAHQTLPADSLHLSREEKAALVAFMKALTDTAGMTGRPAGAKP